MSTRRNIRSVGGVLLLLTGVAACEGPPVAKSNPTWEADVYPILQGQCLHCHGDTADKNGKGSRFDFYDFSNCGDILIPGKKKTAVDNNLVAIAGFVEGGGSRAFMPPAPASVLADWEVQTLKNFLSKKTRGTRRNNRDPKIIITSDLPANVGDELKVSYRFEDADGNPVIGVLRLGDAKVDLLKNSGEVTITDITGNSGDKLTLTVEICDGWTKVSEERGEIERR